MINKLYVIHGKKGLLLVQWHMERGPRAKGYTVEGTPGNRDGSSHLRALLGRQEDYGSL